MKCKSAAALANLASLNPEVLRSKIDPRALISAAVHGESRVQALRCMFNLSNDENSVDWLIQAGALPVVLSGLTKTVSEVQRHAASIIANVAINPQIRYASHCPCQQRCPNLEAFWIIDICVSCDISGVNEKLMLPSFGFCDISRVSSPCQGAGWS